MCRKLSNNHCLCCVGAHKQWFLDSFVSFFSLSFLFPPSHSSFHLVPSASDIQENAIDSISTVNLHRYYFSWYVYLSARCFYMCLVFPALLECSGWVVVLALLWDVTNDFCSVFFFVLEIFGYASLLPFYHRLSSQRSSFIILLLFCILLFLYNKTQYPISGILVTGRICTGIINTIPGNQTTYLEWI